MPHFRFSAPAFLLLGLAAVFALTGCSTYHSRAKEKAAVFAALDPATQARLEARDIRVGDTPDMVYIALGKPTEKKEKLTGSGTSGIWIYTARWDEYQGTRLVGYRSVSVYDPATKSYRVSYVPDYQPVYAPREEDRLRVTFADGVVSVIEVAQPEATPPNSAIK